MLETYFQAVEQALSLLKKRQTHRIQFGAFKNAVVGLTAHNFTQETMKVLAGIFPGAYYLRHIRDKKPTRLSSLLTFLTMVKKSLQHMKQITRRKSYPSCRRQTLLVQIAWQLVRRTVDNCSFRHFLSIATLTICLE